MVYTDSIEMLLAPATVMISNKLSVGSAYTSKSVENFFVSVEI